MSFHYPRVMAPLVSTPLRPSELEAARPQTVGEEELQLQLALAMSKEEAEQEEQKKRSDDVRLQMAITQSEEDFKYVICWFLDSDGLSCLLLSVILFLSFNLLSLIS